MLQKGYGYMPSRGKKGFSSNSKEVNTYIGNGCRMQASLVVTRYRMSTHMPDRRPLLRFMSRATSAF